MQNSKQEYNRLELILLANMNYDFMGFQPYRNKSLYILHGTDFILYDIQPTEAEKMELIRRVVTNRIQIEKSDKDTKGYFSDTGFGNYAYYDDMVIFSFLYIEKDKEHLAVPFTHLKACDGVEKFGYMYDGSILNAEETTKYIEEITKEQHIQFLEELSTVSFGPVRGLADAFNTKSVVSFFKKHYGKPTTTEEISLRFKELSKIHHPDAGGDELMFKAISNGKQYLIDKINYKNGT